MGHLSRISLREILTRSQFLEKRNPEKSFSESSRIQLRYLTICRHKRMNAASKFADQDIYNRLGRQITKTAHSANQTKQIRRPQKNKTVPKNKKRECTDLFICPNRYPHTSARIWPCHQARIQMYLGFSCIIRCRLQNQIPLISSHLGFAITSDPRAEV